ncbi:Uncharacterised protein [Burkholderia pseudomallei]|uniref:hypothetical protein n=1 Tax=Burkholderia pseudomallei TaxID=28450 RepID=UPI000F1685E1|nr:hypothetical protein [Burkholderia pseudomallei]CAJ4098311.1 Uncharacterised protein [Burkholderia pseudomallei]VBQ02559.1 Uncharacterised protein [Burkholderia pseudomallei]
MAAVVHQKFEEVESRLSQLGLTRDIVIEVVQACVAGYAGCTDNDPPGAPGYSSWRYGVRRSRELLRPLGWLKDNTGGYATCLNREKKVRLAIMNADDGAGIPDRVPQNRSKKGPNSERAAFNNKQVHQFALPDADDWPVPEGEVLVTDLSEYATWHVCVFIKGDIVQAELSLLGDFDGGYASECLEKIILVAPGEWNTPIRDQNGSDDDDDLDAFPIEVTRK